MMRFFKVVIVSFVMILASSVEANAQSSKFNWGPVMDAIIQLESKGNALAVNGSYVGVPVARETSEIPTLLKQQMKK